MVERKRLQLTTAKKEEYKGFTSAITIKVRKLADRPGKNRLCVRFSEHGSQYAVPFFLRGFRDEVKNVVKWIGAALSRWRR
jgi:hypothetical protein